MRTDVIMIFITCGSKKEAKEIVDSLLRKRLIACANTISGVESRFWWKERLERAEEVLVMMKTMSGNFKDVEKEIRRIHSYEVPEIIGVPITAGSKEYLEWLRDS